MHYHFRFSRVGRKPDALQLYSLIDDSTLQE
nr:MAG TPA: hypothetical protein [Crassvirales sp.]